MTTSSQLDAQVAATTNTGSDSEINTRVQAILNQMTLPEKIGQMTQVEKNSIAAGDITEMGIGSILSGGGGYPEPNTPQAWRNMIDGFQKEAVGSRLGIPLIYGVDAVHGHNNVVGATIFPHNIGLGSANDPDLVKRIAQATAREMAATGTRWNFAPAVSIPHDVRWGRSYEGYSQDSQIVTELSTAYVKGLIGNDPTAHDSILPSVKHFVGDGTANWGTSRRISEAGWAEDATLANANVGEDMLRLLQAGAWSIDQGDSTISEEDLRAIHLAPYKSAIEAGALNIMASYHSWHGLRMHEHHYLLTELLKNEWGFKGFVVTDWEAIDQITKDFYDCVVRSITAGIDMVMVPFHYQRFITTAVKAVTNGDLAIERINDAVSRILYVKFKMGLFENPFVEGIPLETVGCTAHRNLAKEAVHKSAILLKNEQTLPLSKQGQTVHVAGAAANDIGFQCGGWTITWMGSPGPITKGSTILEGLQAGSEGSTFNFAADGQFDESADVGIVVLAEIPYAEGMGDRRSLELDVEQTALVDRVRAKCDKLVVILISGRPMIVTDVITQADAFIAAWQPGTEGAGISDLLLGDVPFTGRLTFVWPRSMDQIPLKSLTDPDALFPIGHGLSTE